MAVQLADSEVFRAFATYATIVLVKMMLMSVMTAYFRITRKVFANREDAAVHAKGGDVKRFLKTDEDVERVRRCHLNDIENIVPFIGIGLVYALTNPDLFTALLHFRVFAGSRILHSISYLTPLPQPSRALTWATGYGVTISMAYRVLQTVLYF
ncbi:microsomal glutathione S-transferase 1 [Discoglossus pictus]